MIAIVDYGAGNTASVSNALNELGANFIVSSNEIEICRADKIILPGVGEASFAMKRLHRLNLYSTFRIIKKPFLGICLGAQLLCDFSKEGDVACLGAIPATVKKFDELNVTVPHMGWTKIEFVKESPLFKGVEDETFFYFANSFYIEKNEYATSIAKHGVEFSTSIEKDNFYGVQFHPEKSGKNGLKILKNFVEL